MKSCPFCAQENYDDALFCRHCGHVINMRSPFANRHKLEMQAYATSKKVWLAVLLNLVPLIFGLGFLYLDRLGRFFLVFSMQMLILFSLTAFGNPQFHLFLLGLLWLFSILDAYWQAKAHNDNLELI